MPDVENHEERKSFDLIAFGSELKDLGDGKLGGYLVRFTTPEDPDLTGDFFDAKTDIHFPDSLPVLYNHGLDSTMKRTVIGSARPKVDDVGVWVELQLSDRSEYEKAIHRMAMQGKLGLSSGALSHLVDREPAGKAMHIKTWFIGEASLTPTPAEYRNTVQTLKSLEASEQAALSDEDVEKQDSHKETKHMDEKDEVKAADTKALVDAAVADALAKRDAIEKAEAAKQAEIKAAEDAGYKKALEELKNRKAFRYHSTEPTDDDNDGVGAFKSWMQTGEVNHGLIPADSSWEKSADGQKAAWNITTGASGSFLVPDPLFNQIIAKRDNASWVRQLPCQFFQTSADHLLVPVEDTQHTNFVLTAEAASYNENEGEVAQKDLILYKYTNLTKVNEEFLMYNSTNWESWFAGAMGRAVAGTENSIFTDGTGSSQPQGVVAGATVANSTATTDIILSSEITTLLGYLGDGYNVQSECGLLMNNTTLWYLLGTTNAGHQVFPTAFLNSSPEGKQLFGYKVVIDDDVDVYTVSGGKVIVFGNFNYFGVVERPGMMVQRNPYLYMATGQVGIFSSIFRGSAVLQGEAFYYLTNVAG